MPMDHVLILLKMAKMGALERYVALTTGDLGEMLGMSQQSASLYLNTLEEQGLIERIRRKSGGKVRVTEKGVDLLDTQYRELRSLFGEERRIRVSGEIVPGLGEGAYYLSQRRYREQIREKFDMEPFPGTLNVELSMNDRPLMDLLRRGPGITIEGFSTQGRTFGTCLCYRCDIDGIPGVIMVPERSIHEHTLEIISEGKIRDTIDDPGAVKITVEYPSFE